MGSKFLGSANGVDLTDGSAQINIRSAAVQSLLPSLPVHTTAARMLTSGLIQASDCAFVPLDNPATADMNMSGFSVVNAANINGVPVANLVSNPSTSTTSHVAVFSDATGKVVGDGGHALSEYLPLAGGTMAGDINANSHNLTNVGNLNSVAVSQLVSNAGGSTSGDLATFSGTSGIVVQDSGHALSEYFRADGTSSMTGDIAANGNNLTGVNQITTSGLNAVLGSSLSVSGNLVVAIGDSVSAVNDTTAVGRNATCSANQCVAIGGQASCTGPNGASLGYLATCPGGQNCVALGVLASAGAPGQDNCIAVGGSSTASAALAIALGYGANNALANSCLIGDSSITNVYPNNASACDLGSTGSPFKACWLKYAQPAVATSYVQYSLVYVSGTTTETSLTSGATAVGSLTFPATQATGMVIRWKIFFAAQVAAGTLTFTFTVGGSLILNAEATIPNVGTAGTIEAEFTISSTSNLIGYITETISGQAPLIFKNASIGYTSTSSNVWDVTAKFSSSNPSNSVGVDMISVDAAYCT